jgi:tRNA(Ile)-lysidine synthetase-like protein
MNTERGHLAPRFLHRVRRRGVIADGDRVVVAVSGGLDSIVLLHLLRFTPDLPGLDLVVAHLDHAMRQGSEEDAEWLGGLARAWDLPLRTERLPAAPSNEADARRARYGFLERVRQGEAARCVLTAHQGDDQAETVLFRAARGAGIAGLGGIRERRAPAVWRPLLPFSRVELTAYAAQVGLSWREDPTNLEAYPRNVLRHRVLPVLEESVAPGARRALARLARRAQGNEAAWRSVLPGLLDASDARIDPESISVDRASFLGHHPAVRARLVRVLAEHFGSTPSAAGTRRSVEFSKSGASGMEVPLGKGVVLRRELDRLVVLGRRRETADEPGRIPDAGPGKAHARVGGCDYVVSWGREPLPDGSTEEFAVAALRFPLVVRGWQPGDRIRMPYGAKKLKKLFLEARVPALDRARLPVLADADDTVLWIPGVARAAHEHPEGGQEALFIKIIDADSD